MTLTDAQASDLFRAEPDRFPDVGAGPDVLFVQGWPVSVATFRLRLAISSTTSRVT